MPSAAHGVNPSETERESSSNQSLLTVVDTQGGWVSSDITATVDGQSELFESAGNPHRQLSYFQCRL